MGILMHRHAWETLPMELRMIEVPRGPRSPFSELNIGLGLLEVDFFVQERLAMPKGSGAVGE